MHRTIPPFSRRSARIDMAACGLGLTSLFAIACADSPSQLPPLPDDPTGSFLAVASSDFSSGALHTVDLATLAVRKNIDVLDANPVVRAYGSQLFVLDQSHGSMRVYDLAQDFANPKDYPIGKNPELPAAQGNPYDVYIDTPRNVAYVSLYGSFGATAVTGDRALAVLDLADPAAGIGRFVQLPVASGDSDGNPDATRLIGCGDKLYVLLQDLDRNNGYTPVAAGRLAIVNLLNTSDVSIIQLAGENPTAITALADCTQAIVGSAGNQLTGALNGNAGIERVDLVGKQTSGIIIKDSKFGGNVSTLDAVDAHTVFVDISSKVGMSYNNDVYLVDAITGTTSQRLLGPLGFVPMIRATAGRLMVLSAGSQTNGHLKTGIFVGSSSGLPLPTDPIDLGLPPISADTYKR